MHKKKDPAKARSHRRTGIFLAIAGVLLLALGIWDYIDSKAFMAKAKTTEGVVIDVIQKTKRDKNDDIKNGERTYYDAKIKYVVDNKAYDLRSGESSTYDYHKDEKVTVYYDPADPGTARMDDGNNLTTRSMWMGGFGLIALIGAIVYFIYAKRLT